MSIIRKITGAYTPALTCDGSGEVWVAYTRYNSADGTRSVLVRPVASDAGDDVLLATGDVLSPGLAADGQGRVWAVWSQQRDGFWDICAKDAADASSEECALNSPDTLDALPVAATDTDGRVWVAWQSRDGAVSDIVLRRQHGEQWLPPLKVTDGDASNWQPSLAPDQDGGMWVAWDTFRNGCYDVYLRHIDRDGTLGEPVRCTTDRTYDMDVTIATDADGGVWVLWRKVRPWGVLNHYLDEGGQLCLRRYDPTAGCFGLHARRPYRYRVRSADYGIVPVPVDIGHQRLPVSPTLAIDGAGRLHVLYRRFEDFGEGGWSWNLEHLSYGGESWSEPQVLSPEAGYGFEKAAACRDGDGRLCVAIQGCPLADVYDVRDVSTSSVYVLRPDVSGEPDEPAACDTSRGTAHILAPPTDLEELACRREVLAPPDADGRRLIWGDLHRHTMCSSCQPDRDGSLIDTYRWALDPGGLGFYATADHIDTMSLYTWGQTLAYADLFNADGDLATLYSFEATYYKEHLQLNHYYTDRRLADVVRRASLVHSLQECWDIFDEHDLAGKVLSARHYHGDNDAPETCQLWRDDYERFFEVVQARGFCLGKMEALLSRGKAVGVIGGSDHTRNPGAVMPYKYAHALTGLWVTDITREGVFDALAARRSIATNGKHIGLSFRIDGRFMGETCDCTAAPVIHVEAAGPTDIETVEVIRDGQCILRKSVGARQVTIDETDKALPPGTHYYYVIVTQRPERLDNYKGVAVSSPVWVTKRD